MAFDERKTLRVRWTKKEGWKIAYPSKNVGYSAADLIGGRITFKEFTDELQESGFDTTSLTINVHRREFECIQSVFSFIPGKRYFLRSDTKNGYQLSSDDGLIHTFARSEQNAAAADIPYLNAYFNEIKRKG